jgi:uncharacterized protein with FMN-binding domain
MRTSTVKSIAALALTGAGSALVLGFQTTPVEIKSAADSTGTTSAAGSGTDATSNSSTTGTSGAGSGTTATPAPAASAGATGTTSRYADGTWTGKAVGEPWGPFQVQVVVSGGSIVKVAVVESPSDRRSTRINSQAVPLLTQSVMASQGAGVDAVSGATWTSESYATSLQSALDKAAAAA